MLAAKTKVAPSANDMRLFSPDRTRYLASLTTAGAGLRGGPAIVYPGPK
jgi:hypothetical protein